MQHAPVVTADFTRDQTPILPRHMLQSRNLFDQVVVVRRDQGQFQRGERLDHGPVLRFKRLEAFAQPRRELTAAVFVELAVNQFRRHQQHVQRADLQHRTRGVAPRLRLADLDTSLNPGLDQITPQGSVLRGCSGNARSGHGNDLPLGDHLLQVFGLCCFTHTILRNHSPPGLSRHQTPCE